MAIESINDSDIGDRKENINQQVPISPPPAPRKDTSTTIIILAVSLSVLLCLGVITATAFLVGSRLKESSTQPTNPPCPQPPSDWTLYVYDNFNSNLNYWNEGKAENELGSTNWYLLNGKYFVDVDTHSGLTNYSTPDFPDLPIVEDFFASIDAQEAQGPTDSYYGIVFHITHGESYYFDISDTQEYAVWLFKQQWTILIDWKKSTLIKPYKLNRLTVFGQGARYIFCINDQYVDQIYNYEKQSGTVGVSMGVEKPDSKATFIFDNFRLLTPGK